MKYVFLISNLILTVSMFATNSPNKKPIAIEAIHVLEIKEEINLDFDVSKYLPANFNPLKGKDDINWNTVGLIELEEEVNFDFNPQDYLPKGFNPYKGMVQSNSCSK